jgi:hypothetical protein
LADWKYEGGLRFELACPREPKIFCELLLEAEFELSWVKVRMEWMLSAARGDSLAEVRHGRDDRIIPEAAEATRREREAIV